MKILIKIDTEGQIHIIGDKDAKSGGTLHFEQWAGNAIAIEASPTGEIVKTVRGVTIQDFGLDFSEMLGLDIPLAVHGNIEIEATANDEIKGLRNY